MNPFRDYRNIDVKTVEQLDSIMKENFEGFDDDRRTVNKLFDLLDNNFQAKREWRDAYFRKEDES